MPRGYPSSTLNRRLVSANRSRLRRLIVSPLPLVQHHRIASLVNDVVYGDPALAVVASGVGELHLGAPGNPPADADGAAVVLADRPRPAQQVLDLLGTVRHRATGRADGRRHPQTCKPGDPCAGRLHLDSRRQ